MTLGFRVAQRAARKSTLGIALVFTVEVPVVATLTACVPSAATSVTSSLHA